MSSDLRSKSGLRAYKKVFLRGKQYMIYINGIRASKKDLARLLKDLAEKRTEASAHTTKKGALAITTNN